MRIYSCGGVGVGVHPGTWQGVAFIEVLVLWFFWDANTIFAAANNEMSISPVLIIEFSFFIFFV